jgi:hypothetical protein
MLPNAHGKERPRRSPVLCDRRSRLHRVSTTSAPQAASRVRGLGGWVVGERNLRRRLAAGSPTSCSHLRHVEAVLPRQRLSTRAGGQPGFVAKAADAACPTPQALKHLGLLQSARALRRSASPKVRVRNTCGDVAQRVLRRPKEWSSLPSAAALRVPGPRPSPPARSSSCRATSPTCWLLCPGSLS